MWETGKIGREMIMQCLSRVENNKHISSTKFHKLDTVDGCQGLKCLKWSIVSYEASRLKKMKMKGLVFLQSSKEKALKILAAIHFYHLP